MRLTRHPAPRRPHPPGRYAPPTRNTHATRSRVLRGSSDASCLQGLAHGHQLASPLALQFGDLFRGVVVDAAAGLDAELALRGALGDVGGDIGTARQFLVEI